METLLNSLTIITSIITILSCLYTIFAKWSGPLSFVIPIKLIGYTILSLFVLSLSGFFDIKYAIIASLPLCAVIGIMKFQGALVNIIVKTNLFICITLSFIFVKVLFFEQ